VVGKFKFLEMSNGSLTVLGGPGNVVTATDNLFDDFAPVGAANFSIFNAVAGQTVLNNGNYLEGGANLLPANFGGAGAGSIM
jgi:hypothetical protein